MILALPIDAIEITELPINDTKHIIVIVLKSPK